MKKILALLLSVMMVAALAACASAPAKPEGSAEPSPTEPVSSATPETPEAPEAPTSVTVSTLNVDRQAAQVEVPYNPQRLAVMDMSVLDMLDSWGLGDRVIGMVKNTYVDYLDAYIKDENIQNLGTLHESDLEAMMAAEPDVIFIGGRMSAQYDELSKIAPVVYMGVDYEIGLVQSVKNNANNLASIFGLESVAKEQLEGFDARISALAAAAEGKTTVNGIVTSGGINTLGNAARCSLIGGEIGFENLANDVDATHGNEASFELLVALNPDYIFVLDRDAAIATEGAQLAQEVMENELVQKTSAYQNDQIIYLTPAPWYLAEGGITSLDMMLRDVEGALLG